jgi:hypothetical protein
METEETTDQGLEDEELEGDVEESIEGKDVLWDEILIEDEDLESTGYSD